jgi:hypothetical protein
MGSLSFSSVSFLIAGAVCATGPIIIHLLNRRRYHVVQWAAMDFLRQALKTNRKIVQLRDLLLLVMRTLAVLLLGAALARPYLSSRKEAFDDRQPLHAIIVIDNSLSMAYESLDGTLLDKAKGRARELIDRLPAGSQVTVLPACGTSETLNFDPLEIKDDAKEAINKIDVVERSAKLSSVVALARRACEEAPQLAKRVVFFGDQQALNWQDARQGDLFRDLPAIQVVSVAPAEWENTWIADLRLQDGLADLETPATVVAKIGRHGSSARRDLQVTLSVGQTVVGQQAISFESGTGVREVSFECVFSGLTEIPEPGQAVFVPLQVAITPDRLPADDARAIAAPIVAALPVVFIDQYGDGQEDAARGRLGETRHLRRLLAPRTSRSDARRQLISVRHISPESLTHDLLSDVRLIVVAGVREPAQMAGLLADYVRDGGQLMIAAGADFDVVAWNTAGWLDGQGILPLPLMSEPIGGTPEELGDRLRPFSLSLESVAHEASFRLAGLSDADLQALYTEAFFFKAVRVDEWAGTTGSEGKESLGEKPRVFARFDDAERSIFLVARNIGRGQTLFCSTGLLSSWNTLPKTNAFLIFDRLLRDMIQNTLPERTLTSRDYFTLPLPRWEQNTAVTLTRPDRTNEETLEVSYIGAQERGVTIRDLLKRGVYQIRGKRIPAGAASDSQKPIWELPLIVSGDSKESDLTVVPRREFDELAGNSDVRWIAPGEDVTLAGATTRSQGSWWWLVVGIVVLLTAEMLVVANPSAGSSNPS